MPKPTRYLKQLEDELLALGDDGQLCSDAGLPDTVIVLLNAHKQGRT
jgi:hypothetical protein